MAAQQARVVRTRVRATPSARVFAGSAGLAHSGPAELARAWAHRDLLLAAARRLLASDDGRDGRYAAHDLVRRLALVEDAPVMVAELAWARQAFEDALTDAVDAVRCCRQTDHRLGRCWFAAEPGGDGCSEVLRAAHRLG